MAHTTGQDEVKFGNVRSAYVTHDARRREINYRLDAKYGPRRWYVFMLNATERKQRQTLDRQESRLVGRMFDILDRRSSRQWRTGAPLHWIMTELSWQDATTSGQLSVVPPPAFGQSADQVRRFAGPLETEPVEAWCVKHGPVSADHRRHACAAVEIRELMVR